MRLSLLLIAVLAISSCVTYRVHDDKALEEFKQAKVQLAFRDFVADNHKIHYAVVGDAGDKPTLFFIHGSPASWHCFENYMKDSDLLRKYRIVAIDRPGFGYSDFGEPLTVTQQADVIGKLVVMLQNGKPFYVLGHSLGGPIATKVAAAHPNEVNGLVILAGAVEPYEEKGEPWRKAVMEFNGLLPGAWRVCNTEIWWFKDDVQTMPADLHAIKCPVRIFQGLADHMVTPGNGYYAQKELVNSPSVKLMTFEGGHHDIPWTRYDSVKAALMEWR